MVEPSARTCGLSRARGVYGGDGGGGSSEAVCFASKA
jgi:hypothetical protein